LAQQSSTLKLEPQWVPTETLVLSDKRALKSFSGNVPASPYRNADGVLGAIKYLIL
jgi:hypothetical protein